MIFPEINKEREFNRIMTISKEKNELEALIYGVVPEAKQSKNSKTSSTKTNEDVVDKDSDDLEPEPIFSFDYENDMKGFRKRAYKTVWTMARHIIPEDILTEDYVKNKIEQDVDTLSELYWTRKSNTDIKLSIMDGISKGNTAPRMYDAYKSINDSIADNNKQIIMTEENLRKTYTDLKYEIQCRRAEKETKSDTKVIAGGKVSGGIIGQGNKEEQEGITITGTKGIIDMMKQQKKEEYKKSIAEDVEFS